ncbi:MAG: biliverdin-producing heme oxygenase [Sumerlaeia bacterium]
MTQAAETTELTLIQRLKAGIWDIHEGVANPAQESSPKSDEDNIMKGTLPRFKYVNNLKQRYLLQKAFEEVLAAHRDSEPFLNRVVTDEQFHAPKAAEDLRFFGVDPDTVKSLPATEDMIAFFHATAERDPRLLLSIHYIIEGSNNGAMFIAKAVKKAYDLEGTDGTYHLQPYGPAIREKWSAFGQAFNTLPIDDALMAKMIQVGRETFGHMNKVGAESYAQPESAA